MSPSFGYILNMAAADVFMLLHLGSVLEAEIDRIGVSKSPSTFDVVVFRFTGRF